MSMDDDIKEYERRLNRLKCREEIEEIENKKRQKLMKLKQEYREKKYKKPMNYLKKLQKNIQKLSEKKGTGKKNWWQ